MNTEKLRELLGAATPGPWSVVADPSHYHTLSTVVGGYRGLRDFQFRAEIGGQASWKEQEANAALIVAAVNALPALLARLEAAERVVEAAREALPMIAYAYSEGISKAELVGRALEVEIAAYDGATK